MNIKEVVCVVLYSLSALSTMLGVRMHLCTTFILVVLYSVERDAQLKITLAATTRAQGHMIPRHVTRSQYVLHEMWDTSKLTRQVAN